MVVGVLLSSCSTSLTSIRTNPEGADVFVIRGNNQKSRLGTAPLNIPSQQLNPSNEPNVQIMIQKEGYKDETYFLPKMTFSSSMDLSVQLKEEPAPPSCEVQSKNTEKVARNIAQALFFTQQKKYDQAETLLNNLIVEVPNVSVIYDLLGNIYYLNQKTDLALDAYQKSLEINPNSAETQRMVNKLRAIRSPSGGGL